MKVEVQAVLGALGLIDALQQHLRAFACGIDQCPVLPDAVAMLVAERSAPERRLQLEVGHVKGEHQVGLDIGSHVPNGSLVEPWT